MKVFVCGDTHCPIDMYKLGKHVWPEKRELTEDDILIQLGDFGVVWKGEPDKTELYWRKWFDERKFKTIVVPGNHENYFRIMQLPIIEMFGAKMRQYSENIFFVERGEVLELDGKKLFCFGGAKSHDKAWRTEGVSWWPEEIPSHEEIEHALDKIEEYNATFDFILTHTAPQSIVESMLSHKSSDDLGKFFEHIAMTCEFDEWHFGHMHEDRSIGRYHCHYNLKPTQII